MLQNPLKVINYAFRMFEEEKAPQKDINDHIILSPALNSDLTLSTFDNELKAKVSRKRCKRHSMIHLADLEHRIVKVRVGPPNRRR